MKNVQNLSSFQVKLEHFCTICRGQNEKENSYLVALKRTFS